MTTERLTPEREVIIRCWQAEYGLSSCDTALLLAELDAVRAEAAAMQRAWDGMKERLATTEHELVAAEADRDRLRRALDVAVHHCTWRFGVDLLLAEYALENKDYPEYEKFVAEMLAKTP